MPCFCRFVGASRSSEPKGYCLCLKDPVIGELNELPYRLFFKGLCWTSLPTVKSTKKRTETNETTQEPSSPFKNTSVLLVLAGNLLHFTANYSKFVTLCKKVNRHTKITEFQIDCSVFQQYNTGCSYKKKIVLIRNLVSKHGV